MEDLERVKKVDDGFAKMDERFDGLERKTEARFDRLEGKNDERFGKVEGRIGNLEVSVARIETQVAHMQADTGAIKQRMDDFARDLKALAGELHSAKIWALLVAAGLLGVLAKGFHWI